MYKVLIVEDETLLRDKMVKNIDWFGNYYSVLQASNGEQALEILQQEEIDILITDIKMSGMSGMELARKSKILKENIKVIIISGHAEFEYAQQSIRLGVDDYLLKPFRSTRLLEVVNLTRDKILKEHKDREQLEQLRWEVAEYLKHNRIDNALKWLNDDEFFEKQSLILENNKLYQALKTGSQEEVNAQVERLLQEIDFYRTDRQQHLIFLNNVILFAFRTIKEFGYSFSELMQLIKKNNLTELSVTEPWKIKDLL